MSVSSILAFVLAGVAAKKSRADRQDENRQELIALRIDNADLRRRVEELEGDVARANVQARRDQELIDAWRERALAIIPPLQPAGPDFRPPQFALQQDAALQQMQLAQSLAQSQSLAQYSQQAQYNAQQAMAAQNFYGQGLANMGLLGAQNLIDAELWCNCVPSRSQVWATSDPE
jgi:hypothetical protein